METKDTKKLRHSENSRIEIFVEIFAETDDLSRSHPRHCEHVRVDVVLGVEVNRKDCKRVSVAESTLSAPKTKYQPLVPSNIRSESDTSGRATERIVIVTAMAKQNKIDLASSVEGTFRT